VGNHAVTFTVTDDGAPPASDSEPIVITVGNVNRPPVLAPIGNRSAAVGTPMQIALSAADPDGDALVLTCAGLPGGASLTDLGDGTGVIDWTPGAAGSARASCSVTDAGVPPLSDAESFAMTGTDATSGGGATVVMDDARWIARGAKLRVRGRVEGGSGSRARIAIYSVAQDGSGFLLGTASSRARSFAIDLRPFVAPCQVAAALDGHPGTAVAVTGAPADCGESLLAWARAELACGDHVLHVEGRRGPPGGAMVFVDPTTGRDLARISVRGRSGEFAFEGIVDGVPDRLQLRAELGSGSWLLPSPLPVRRGECREEHEDEESDE
jgi:hypothetical protein